MGWLQNWVQRSVKRAAKYAGIPLRDPALVALLGNQPTAAGVDVDESSAMGISAFWQGVTLIASNVASMPVALHDGPDEIPNDPLHQLLSVSPNDRMTPFVFFETVQGHAITWGNGYARIDREADAPDAPISALVPLPPNQTTPELDQETGEPIYRFQAHYPGEVDRILEPWEVVHIPGFGYDGLKGYPVVQLARESLGLGMAQERHGAAFFGRGCALGGILEVPDELEMTDKARKNLRESFELLHRGPDNAHRVAILENGVKWIQTSIPPEDAQFLQSRQFQVVEVARWLNIPPHLLRDLTHATFSNIEHQGIDFLLYTLRPWLIRWAQELRRKLLPKKRRARCTFRHKTRSLLLTDITARYNAYNVGRNAGFLTINDINKEEGLPLLPPELGESRLIPANMRAVDGTGQDVLVGPANDHDRASAQAASLLAILQSVGAGTLHPDSARPLLSTAHPDLGADAIEEMLVPYVVVTGQGEPTASPPEDTAMNGAQVASLMQILLAVAAGQLEAEAGQHMIEIAFPDVPSEKIVAMLAPYRIPNAKP